jgi:hypothetical protein
LTTCWSCGEPIVFRHVDGVLKPIHLNGGWCNGGPSSPSPSQFRTVESYVNPNAYCPVCGDKVFFFQSRYGGRVYFDDVGWPWPKHPCTDRTETTPRVPRAIRGNTTIQDKQGNRLEIYDLDDLQEDDERFIFTFRSPRGTRLNLRFSKPNLRKGGVTIHDFWDAPSFLIRKDPDKPDSYRVEFISARLHKIIRVRMKRAT